MMTTDYDPDTLPLPDDQAALYDLLDRTLRLLSRVHSAIAETYSEAGVNGDDHAGEADDAEGMREYWASVRARPDRPRPGHAAIPEVDDTWA